MSGFKKALVTINEEEYKRLHNRDMERLFKQSNPPSTNVVESNTNNVFQNNLIALQQRQEQFFRTLENTQNQLYTLEVETERNLVAEKMEFYQELFSQTGAIWENAARIEDIICSLQEQNRLDNEIRDIHIQNTKDQVGRIIQNQNNKFDLVDSWINSSCALGELIVNQFDHERYYPGIIEKFYGELNLAQTNLDQGMPEAAIVQVQRVYIELSELRLALEQKTLEMAALYSLVHSAAINLYERLRANSSCTALDLDGKESDIAIMLNYWSNGRYSDLMARIKSLIRWIIHEKDTITFDQLGNIFQNDLPGFQKDFESIIYDARLSAINSQLRTNIADIAIQALQTQGFTQSEFGYESDDKRCPFFVRLENIEGSQVTIRVSSINDQEIKNDLTVESHDSQELSERELKIRSNEVRNSLVMSGLQVGSMETVTIEPKRILRVQPSHRSMQSLTAQK